MVLIFYEMIARNEVYLYLNISVCFVLKHNRANSDVVRIYYFLEAVQKFLNFLISLAKKHHGNISVQK